MSPPLETFPAQPDIEGLFLRLQEFEPSPVKKFVPANGAEERQAFLAGQTDGPKHQYDKLDAIDFDATIAEIDAIGEQVLTNPSLNPKFVDAYQDFFEGYKKERNSCKLHTRLTTQKTQTHELLSKTSTCLSTLS